MCKSTNSIKNKKFKSSQFNILIPTSKIATPYLTPLSESLLQKVGSVLLIIYSILHTEINSFLLLGLKELKSDGLLKSPLNITEAHKFPKKDKVKKKN